MLDRRLHGGDAWRLLQPLLGHPLVTRLLDGAYAVWFFVWLSLWLAVAGGADRALRRRHCVSFVLVWALLGTLVGTTFASGGPVYYGRLVGGPDPFVPLMDYLHRTSASFPLWSTTLQEALWGLYVQGVEIGQGGLSAMPSLHVAVATLCALTGTRLDRRLGAALWLFVAVVGLATVQLGWHYAIDAYAGALGTLAIWHAVGWASEGRRAMTVGPGPMAPDATGPLQARQEG
jgi:membrane-associated phospholipid phosphatase